MGVSLGVDYGLTSRATTRTPRAAPVVVATRACCASRVRRSGSGRPGEYQAVAVTYKIKEIFYTLQGEGAHAGRPAVFCRFSLCNLWTGREKDRARAICKFCDTDFVGTDGEGGGRFATRRRPGRRRRGRLADSAGSRTAWWSAQGVSLCCSSTHAAVEALQVTRLLRRRRDQRHPGPPAGRGLVVRQPEDRCGVGLNGGQNSSSSTRRAA